MRFKMMVLVAATVLAVPAIAQTADTAAPAATPQPKPKKEKKICKSAEPNSYSRMTTTVCRTQAEWDSNPTIGNGNAAIRSVGSDGVTSR